MAGLRGGGSDDSLGSTKTYTNIILHSLLLSLSNTSRSVSKKFAREAGRWAHSYPAVSAPFLDKRPGANR